MVERGYETALDAFVSGRRVSALAFAWGFAEATFFFIVPDVLLTLIACRALRPSIRATIAALIGALAGGSVMSMFAGSAPETARLFLDLVPAISPALIGRVSHQLNESGLLSVLLGPIQGIPYKIYAVEWGARGGSLVLFLVISIPARYVRFILAALISRAVARLLEPLTHHQAAIEVSILALIWIAFYVFYFASFAS